MTANRSKRSFAAGHGARFDPTEIDGRFERLADAVLEDDGDSQAPEAD